MAEPSTPQSLAGLFVVDLGGTIATGHCGKWCADLGARVIDIEPPGGNPTRALPPFAAGAPANERSAFAAYLAAGKESVALDPGRASDAHDIAGLCARADLVLAAPDPGDPAAVRRLHELAPRGVVVSITWFGHHGPYAHFRGNEAVVHALAGVVRNIGEATGPPLLPTGYLCEITAGTTAFVAAMTRVLGRGGGCVLEVSVFEAMLALVEPGCVSAYNLGQVLPRIGVNRFWPTFPGGIYRCREGWLGVTALTPAQWRTFCELIGVPELGPDPRYQTALERMAAAATLDPAIVPQLERRTAREWFEAGQHRRLPLALVPTMAELLTTDQFTERGAFPVVEHPDLGHFRAPGLPFRLDGQPPRQNRRAPRLGEHTELMRAELQRPGTTARVFSAPVAGPLAGPAPQPLAGVRIVDLTMGWAGPLATRHLADLGALVCKVESCRHFDWWRGWEVTEAMVRERLYEKSSAFLTANRNKLGITLDLAQASGADLLRRLVARADAVVENYAASVLPKLGLDYPALARVNPRLVMLSMPPFGRSGAWQGYRAYGSTVEQASGLPHLQGRPEWPPTMLHVALGDPIAGITGAAALLAALHRQRATGFGQLVDLSHVEALFPYVAHGVIAQSRSDVPPPRLGGRHAVHAPWGVYRCRGEERWLVIAIDDDGAWQAMCAALDWVALRDDPRFATAAGRKQHEDELDAALGPLLAERDRDAIMHKLQAAGVPAAAVHDALELLFDPHLVARGFWQWLPRDFVGPQPYPSAPYRSSVHPTPITRTAPTLGQHTREVLRDWLDLDQRELDALEHDRIIGTEPILQP